MDGETIIAILIGGALAGFSLFMVVYSFFRGTSDRPPGAESPVMSTDGESDAVGVGLDSIYDSIETLELDFQLGNVPAEQYREEMLAYRLEAAAVIREQIEGGRASPELLLEREVLEARDALRSAQATEDGWRACPQCDAPIPFGDAPCPHCGADTDPDRPEAAVPGSESVRQG